MSAGSVVDTIIGIALILAILSGWRQGAFASVLSAVGVLAGLICGAAAAPFVMSWTDSTALRFLLALAVVILLAGLGNLTGGVLGASLRERMRLKSFLFVDSSVGAVFQALATLIVVWLVAIPLTTALQSTPVAVGIRNSKILSFTDNYAPSMLHTLPSRISAMLSESGLPPLVSPFSGNTSVRVEAPAIKVANTALVEQLRPSAVHVLGEAQGCDRRLMGSGFVIADDYVVTNAHVVAGTNLVALDTVTGLFDAEVVYYNAELDIAVLKANGLGLPTLNWADSPAETGDDAIVMGFPESGPFEAAPARINDRITISGPNIYASGRVEREAYTVRGTIRQGNSGGPMVNNNGTVLGVVFGASVDSSDIGYVLTAEEVRAAIGDITALNTIVDTGECVNH